VKKLENIDAAPASQLVGVKDACTLLDISRATFYRLVKSNKIKLIKIGGGSRASVGNLRQLIGVS
jgi:excisionase family DNA binding protein